MAPLELYKYIHFNNPNKPLLGETYFKFDEPTAGNSMKNSTLCGMFKKCVPIFLKKQSFMVPFYGWGSTPSELEPLRGGSLFSS